VFDENAIVSFFFNIISDYNSLIDFIIC